MDTILVTGGAGFLGSWFVRHWLATGGGPVVVLDKLTYSGSRASLAEVADDPRLVFRPGDIADGSLVAALLAEFRPQAIIHFAAETHVDRSIDSAEPFVATNVVGTWQLLDATLNYWRGLVGSDQRAFRFLQISTDEVFGPIAAPTRATESSPYRPSSPYAASKAAADHFVWSYHRTHGLPAVVVHPSNNYGPFQFPEKFVPLVILNALEGLPLPIYGDGRQTRDWLFGEDLCRAICLVLRDGQPGSAFNVASGQEQTNEDVVQGICALVDRLNPGLPHAPSTNLITHVADRPGHDERYALDTSKIRALGWSPRIDLPTGLLRTIGWYMENRDWVQQVAANFDRSKRLGKGQ